MAEAALVAVSADLSVARHDFSGELTPELF
jgi:hypothetical protein